jgi:hypothetical protein
MNLRELTCRRSPREFVNGFLGEVLTPANVNRFEPALFAPSPGRAGGLSD